MHSLSAALLLLQYLEKNNWSIAACEQVLHNHQEARPFNGRNMVNKCVQPGLRHSQQQQQQR